MNKICHALTVMLLFFGLALAASDVRIQVANPGFEESGVADAPGPGWQIVGKLAENAAVTLDRVVFHSGGASLKLSHRHGAGTTVCSSPLELKVGRLYRLAAAIRTEGAVTDPADRYPTPVAACLSMESFPFTNHSPAAGGSRAWREIEVLFIATSSRDRIRLHLGYNGRAWGTAWFDDVRLEEVTDLSAYIAPETVRRYGPAFRFTDRGWIFLHVEGKPYSRGFQNGYLMADEIVAYMEKLANLQNPANPGQGWAHLRLLTDALLLRQFEEEYLLEMRGTADGCNARKAAMKYKSSAIDLLDIAAINSAVDLGQMEGALPKTGTPLSGRDFPPAGEEQVPERLHKCSSMVATGPATAGGDIVFFQMFMWNGYTGTSFNVICDMAPEKGNRLVYQTFPGGIHSGTDFYLNGSGIMIGETTVQQTAFDPAGLPQSNRIRKAAQYANSIDDVVRILTTRNNGLYTNDWPMADAKTGEVAILLLGTKKYKLWRSGKRDFPGGTEGFYWSDNNAKDPEVRMEYIPDPANAPFDLIYSPSNRDIAFWRFFAEQRGKIDVNAAIRLMASSPINRPHACDGKVTSGEMAREMVFLVHFGKTTLREKFPGDTPRMPTLPEAVPHLTLGYSVFSPKWLAEKMGGLGPQRMPPPARVAADYAATAGRNAFSADALWSNTVFPASERESWFVSASAAYHGLLRRLPAESAAAASYLRDSLADSACRLLFLMEKEGAVVPLKATRAYDRYGEYQIPRLRGIFLLHQLRLCLGNEKFSGLMKEVHSRFREKPMTNAQFLSALEKTGGRQDLSTFVAQWLERSDLPAPRLGARIVPLDEGRKWKTVLEVEQDPGRAFHFFCTVSLETEKREVWQTVEVRGGKEVIEIMTDAKPRRLVFNPGWDIPVRHDRFYTFANFSENFTTTLLVYGTSRQIEANHSLGLRYQTVLADAFSEILPPLKKESELTQEEMENSDLIILGGAADNALVAELAPKLGLELGKNWFSWNGQVYGHEGDGLLAVFPNPDNPKRTVTLLVANSSLQLWQMTRSYGGQLPSWAVYSGERVVERGFHQPQGFIVDFK